MNQIVKICLVIGLAIVTFVFGVVIAIMESKTCLSRPCRAKSILISKSKNSSIDPCQNFYKFACGNYYKYNASKPGRISNIRSELEVMALKTLAKDLGAAFNKTDNPIAKLAKSFYRSCVNIERDSSGFGSLISYVLTTSSGFPLMNDNWTELYKKGFSASKAELEMFRDGFYGGAFVELKLEYDQEKLVLVASIPQAPLRSAPDFNKTLQFYSDMYKAMTAKDPSEAKIDDLKKVVNLKIEVFNVQKRYPRQCPRETYLAGGIRESLGLKSTEFKALNRVRNYVKEAEKFYISIKLKDYLKEVDKIITNIPDYKPVVSNFIILEYFTHLVHVLPKKLRHSYDKYMKDDTERNDVIINDRSLYCARLMKIALPNYLAAQHLRSNKRQITYDRDVRSVINFLKDGMIRKLKQSTWISKSDKSKAISKIRKLLVVTPFSRSDIKELTKPLSGPAKEEWFKFCAGTSVAHELINIHKLSRILMKEFTRSYDLYTTDVTYNQGTNVIAVPALYLSFPMIDQFWPKYTTFGVMGSRLARAMWKSLNFDFPADNPKKFSFDSFDEGYDTYDNNPTVESDEWSNTTMQTYADTRSCILYEYRDFLRPYIRRSVENVMCIAQIPSESLGVQAAYIAYKEYHKSRFFNEPSLPKLKYSNDQHFFIELSTYFCARSSGAYTENMTDYEIGIYSNEFKVNQMLRNNERFVKVFGCKNNDYMSSAKKCSLF